VKLKAPHSRHEQALDCSAKPGSIDRSFVSRSPALPAWQRPHAHRQEAIRDRNSGLGSPHFSGCTASPAGDLAISLWRQATLGIYELLNRTEQDRGTDDEVRHYFEEATAAYKERGLSEEDARRAVRRELGNPNAAQVRERSYGWENSVITFLSDLRFAARQLRRNPGFTTVTNDYSRARHWCQYGNLQRHQSDSFQTAALSPPWPHSDDLEYLAGCVS